MGTGDHRGCWFIYEIATVVSTLGFRVLTLESRAHAAKNRPSHSCRNAREYSYRKPPKLARSSVGVPRDVGCHRHLGVAVGRVTCVCVYQIFVRSFVRFSSVQFQTSQNLPRSAPRSRSRTPPGGDVELKLCTDFSQQLQGHRQPLPAIRHRRSCRMGGRHK